MAKTLTTTTLPNLNVCVLCDILAQNFQMRGYTAIKNYTPDGFRLRLEKGCGGINTLFGLGEGITVHCMHQNNTLIVNYSEGDWTGKIVGLVVGGFICGIPFITAICGCIKQSSFPDKVSKEIMMLLGQ